MEEQKETIDVEAVELDEAEKEKKLKKIGLCLAGLGVLIIGYKIGYKRCADVTNKGFAIVLSEHPDLKEPFAEALCGSLKSKMLREIK